MGLSQDFVDRNIEKAKGAVIFGVPVEELSRDELIACMVAGWEAEKGTMKELRDRTEFLLSVL